MTAAEPGLKYAALHYKTLELDKDRALKSNFGNYDGFMQISSESKLCIKWWIRNIETVNKPISPVKMDRKIETDSSLMGYGGGMTSLMT